MKKLLTICAVVMVMTGVASTSLAAILVDRGLPTANLNAATGASRSNIMWADNEPTSDPATFWLPGDDFTLAGSGAYTVNTIRVWSMDNTGLSLRGGLAGGSIALQSSTFTSTLVAAYDGGLGYQGSSGAYYPVYQIDFSVAIAMNGGQTYQFFLDGPLSAWSGGGFRNAFLHGSNAGLSGSTQQGANDTWLWLAPDGSVQTWLSGTGGGTTGWGAGWDKDSDANVQVFGVPEPATLGLLLIGGLAMLVRRS